MYRTLSGSRRTHNLGRDLIRRHDRRRPPVTHSLTQSLQLSQKANNLVEMTSGSGKRVLVVMFIELPDIAVQKHDEQQVVLLVCEERESVFIGRKA